MRDNGGIITYRHMYEMEMMHMGMTMTIYRAMKQPPCKDCTERSATCHGTCEAYKAFRQYRDEYNKTKAAASEAVAYFRESASKQAQKARRRKR
jgi:hypothetical protein